MSYVKLSEMMEVSQKKRIVVHLKQFLRAKVGRITKFMTGSEKKTGASTKKLLTNVKNADIIKP